jgi:hypothetical protein
MGEHVRKLHYAHTSQVVIYLQEEFSITFLDEIKVLVTIRKHYTTKKKKLHTNQFMTKKFHKLVSILTYEVSWVVLRHHSEANIAEEVHYFMDMPKVGSLCRKRKCNTKT